MKIGLYYTEEARRNNIALMAASFFKARSKEILELAKETSKYPDRGQACQNVPFKCRRRAVSHHRNRIPKRLRKYHTDVEPAKKRPANKYRKRRDPKIREAVCTKNRMVTHKWHAKRFHMSVIDGNWSVPFKANEKNYRATYRAAAKAVYIEDLSYWQCVETSCHFHSHSQNDDSKNSVKINISGVIFDTLQKGLECCEADGSSFAWLEDDEHQTIAMVFFIKISKDKFQWWCHPSKFDSVLPYLSKSAQDVQHRQDLCLFSLLGPECNARIIPKDKNQTCQEKLMRITAADVPISREISKEAGEIYIAAIPGDKSSSEEVGAGFNVIVPDNIGHKLWIQLNHSRVFVGCLDSQEHLDVELKRLTSSKLQQDIGIPASSNDMTLEQSQLMKLGNHWTKSQSHKYFTILRDCQSLSWYENALKSKNGNLSLISSAHKSPTFVPIVIDMVYGGTVKSGSKICFPGTVEKVKKLFAVDVLHAPFYELPIVGLVTTACYSLRRGFSSALGLISGDAIRRFLQGGHFTNEDSFLVAVENDANAKYYVGKFSILKIKG